MSAAPIAARAAVRLHKFAEKRSNQRYPIELEVEYRLLTKGRFQNRGSAKTRNISSRGVLIDARGSVPAGSSIELTLTWPFLLEGVCPLRLVMRGRIVRSDVRGIAIHSNYHEFRTAGSRNTKKALASLAAGAS